MERQEDGSIYLKPSECQEFMERRSDKYWVFTLFERPGAVLAIVTIEYMVYPPETAANDEYDLIHTNWEGMHILVFGFPIKDRNKWEPYLNAAGLVLKPGRLALLDVITREKIEFPIFLPGNSWALEFHRGHAGYADLEGIFLEGDLSSTEWAGRLFANQGALMKRIHEGWRPTPKELQQAFLPRWKP